MRRPVRTRTAAFASVLLLFAVGACSDDDRPDWSDPTLIDFHPILGVELSAMTLSPSGLYVQDLVVGEGMVTRANDRVLVAYTGWLPNGSVFDSRALSDAIEFPLSGVIQGWQEGIQGMQPGGERLLVIPPTLAYGSQGRGPIPSNATLVFRVVLVGLPGRS